MEREGKKSSSTGLLIGIAVVAAVAMHKHHAETANTESGASTLTPTEPFARCVDVLLSPMDEGDPLELAIGLVRRRLSYISETDARALAIDTLVSVCLKKGDEAAALRPYYWRSLRNAIASAGRRLFRVRTCSIEPIDPDTLPDPAEGPPERRVFPNEWEKQRLSKQREAQQAFCRLSEASRIIIEARVIRGLTFREIGDQVGKSEDSVRKMFGRAMEHLKEQVANDSD